MRSYNNQSKIYCPDCSTILYVRNLDRHLSKCKKDNALSICDYCKYPYFKIQCPFNTTICHYCNKQIYVTEKWEHYDKCNNKIINCARCNEKIKIANIKWHINIICVERGKKGNGDVCIVHV